MSARVARPPQRPIPHHEQVHNQEEIGQGGQPPVRPSRRGTRILAGGVGAVATGVALGVAGAAAQGVAASGGRIDPHLVIPAGALFGAALWNQIEAFFRRTNADMDNMDIVELQEESHRIRGFSEAFRRLYEGFYPRAGGGDGRGQQGAPPRQWFQMVQDQLQLWWKVILELIVVLDTAKSENPMIRTLAESTELSKALYAQIIAHKVKLANVSGGVLLAVGALNLLESWNRYNTSLEAIERCEGSIRQLVDPTLGRIRQNLEFAEVGIQRLLRGEGILNRRDDFNMIRDGLSTARLGMIEGALNDCKRDLDMVVGTLEAMQREALDEKTEHEERAKAKLVFTIAMGVATWAASLAGAAAKWVYAGAAGTACSATATSLEYLATNKFDALLRTIREKQNEAMRLGVAHEGRMQEANRIFMAINQQIEQRVHRELRRRDGA